MVARRKNHLGKYVAAAMLVLLSPPFVENARAERDTDNALKAKILFRRGVKAADAENWEVALEYFLKSRTVAARPSTIFNIGTTLLRLERFDEAAGAFEDYLAATERERGDVLRAQARRLIDEARRRAEEKKIVFVLDDLIEDIPPQTEQPAPPEPIRELELAAAPVPSIRDVVPASSPPAVDDSSIVIVALAGATVIAFALAVFFAAGSSELDPYGGTTGVTLGSYELSSFEVRR